MMTSSAQDTVEFIRTCAQVYWKIRNLSNDLKSCLGVKKVEFVQSMYGPDKYEWPGSPVGFSWDVEVLFEKSIDEETYTLEVIYEAEWQIRAVRAQQGTQGGLETVETIIHCVENESSECTVQLQNKVEDFIQYCRNRVEQNA